MKTASLFIPFYTPESAERFAELQHALKKNLEHEWLTRIVLMIDDDTYLNDSPPSQKIIIRRLNRRPTYADWLHYSAELGAGASLSICANADIELGDDFCLKVSQEMGSDQTLLCITRYDLDQNGCRQLRNNPHWTQDTWVLTPAGVDQAVQSLSKQLDIPFGTPRCDNKIPYVFWLRNWDIVNPCTRVHTIHHQQSAHRGYSKNDRSILGGVAYVHPSLECGMVSLIDVDIYSLNSQNPGDIRHNKFLTKKSTANIDKVANAAIASIRKSPHGKLTLHERDLLLFTPRMLDEWTIIHRYSERFLACKKADRIAFVDLKWPTATTYSDPGIDTFSGEQLFEAFLWGFCYPVTEFLPDQFSPSKLFNDQRNFWQYPCRTEQDAFERHVRIAAPCWDHDIAHTYIGLPWATWIDKKEFPLQLIKAFGNRLKAVIGILADKGIKLRVHSVCQHIHWKRHMDSFSIAGITDLWISHKEKGWDIESELRLYAWPLFAVNVQDPLRRQGLEWIPVHKKTIFASFKGAHMNHYLSDIRLKLREVSEIDGYKIDINDLWHFNKLVYGYQVSGKGSGKDLIEGDDIAVYNRLLSHSLFSLCPSGAGPNTLRLWESLGCGSIPVVLSDRYEYPNLEQFGEKSSSWENATIQIQESDVSNMDHRLRRINTSELEHMQAEGLRLFDLCCRLTCFGMAS